MNGFGANSEFGRLSTVLLHKPGPAIGNHPAPSEIQHLRAIDHAALSLEFDAIIATFLDLGIKVLQIDPTPLGEDRSYRYNLMYCRDLLFMTPHGAMISRMANVTRQEEIHYAERTLTENAIPIVGRVSGEGRFEGADALWINGSLVAIGVGGRTNLQGFEEIKAVLQGMNVECLSLPCYQTRTQHLLGTVQIVDHDLALVRDEIVAGEIIPFLEEHGFTVVRVPENFEVQARQAMNIVTVAPRTIVMTAGCPETRSIYKAAGIHVAAELEVTQLLHGAGGLACATGILARG